MPYPTNKGLRRSVLITFEDGTKLKVCPHKDYYVEVELVEPTLDSDVIPIGANTLGEGSI